MFQVFSRRKKIWLGVFLLCLLLLSPQGASAQIKSPVIIVPGLAGSFNFQEFISVPPNLWTWMPPAKPLYTDLIAKLEEAGYSQDDGTLAIAFYDWRKPLAVGSTRVAEVINEAREKYKENHVGYPERVNLVTHSMGGLVAKYYLLGNPDVSIGDYITLGTPHYGLPDAYFAWEGADAYGWDGVTKAATELYGKIYGLRFGKINTIDQVKVVYPGLRDLLPIYSLPMPDFSTGNFLWSDQNPPASVPITTEMNAYNPVLNFLNGLEMQNGLPVEQYHAVAGTNRDTLVKIFVNPNAPDDEIPDDLYPDGVPNKVRTGYPDDGNFSEGEWEFPLELGFGGLSGDGTVPAVSASTPTADDVYLADGVDHTALPSDPCVQKYVFDTLSIPWTYGNCENLSMPEIPQGVAVFYAASPVTLRVKSPDGKVVDGETNQIPGAEYLSSGPTSPRLRGVNSDRITLITIPNPIAGNYQLSLTGIGNGGTYHTGGAYFSDNVSTNWSETSGKIRPRQQQIYQLNLSSEVISGETPLDDQLKSSQPSSQRTRRFRLPHRQRREPRLPWRKFRLPDFLFMI